MLSFPNCKINLGLSITGKRPDGYHDLETIFYPIPYKDALEFLPSEEFIFSSSGLNIPGQFGDNLCVKAYHLLKNDFPQLPNLNIWLHKQIPLGAGLGGGSADGAFMLKSINEYFQLNLSVQQLVQYASKLGSDCPFFILNNPCYARGRGEILETIQLDLTPYIFVIVHPGIHISTAWAFSKIIPKNTSGSMKEIIQQPIENWKEHLINDFEAPVLNEFPELKTLKEKLYSAGALYVSMSGSGSSFYGIFPNSLNEESLKFEKYKSIFIKNKI